MKDLNLNELIDKYNSGECTPEERLVVEHHLLTVVNEVTPPKEPKEPFQYYIDKAISRANRAVMTPERPLSLTVKIALAIAAMITVVLTVYLFEFPGQKSSDQMALNQVKSGSNKAILTLANGKEINLSGTQTGIVIDANKLAYTDGTQIQTGTTVQNNNRLQKLITPKGGQYQVILPDGSKVWLNSASTLSFPQQFTASRNRKVLLAGEAYFEIAKDKNHPFIVESGNQKIQVLGTHFNVNAYADEKNIKTTLLEGSVKVSMLSNAVTERNSGASPTNPNPPRDNVNPRLNYPLTPQPGVLPSTGERQGVILKPSEQATLVNNTITTQKIDPTQAIAWKNGYFQFNEASMSTIMRELARWYDIQVIFVDGQPKGQYTTKIERNIPLGKALKILKLNDYDLKLEGKILTIFNHLD